MLMVAAATAHRATNTTADASPTPAQKVTKKYPNQPMLVVRAAEVVKESRKRVTREPATWSARLEKQLKAMAGAAETDMLQ